MDLSVGFFCPTTVKTDREIGRVFLIRLEGFGRQPILGRGTDPGWRSNLEAGGGGPLIDSGFHSVYRAVDWAGSPVRRVFARIGTYVAAYESGKTGEPVDVSR